MRKAIGVLVIFIFLISIGALILGQMLFAKRELLKGRTQKLEESVLRLGKVIEAQPPVAPEPVPADFPAKDISPCNAEILEKPDLSTFWQKYKRELEVMETPLIDLGTADYQKALMSYYKLNPVDGSIIKNLQGFPVKEGEGTMAEVLDNVLIAKAREQYERLNDTRQQLKDVRSELAETIRDVNKLKPELRERLKEIVELKAEIERLKQEIEGLKGQIQQLKEEKKALEDQITQLKADIVKMQETIDQKEETIKQQEKEIRRLRARGETTDQNALMAPWKPSPGRKGTVTQVNPEWNFIIVELTEEFIAESEKAGRPDPAGVELLVKREGKPEVFVTKIKLQQVKKDQKIAIGDNQPNWQQVPIKVGDVLFY